MTLNKQIQKTNNTYKTQYNNKTQNSKHTKQRTQTHNTDNKPKTKKYITHKWQSPQSNKTQTQINNTTTTTLSQNENKQHDAQTK